MKVFVSSRMNEMPLERKAAIDSLHDAGHTPLYIETQPEITDENDKREMDSLIDQAEALVSLHYLSEGSASERLGHLTPIQYEFDQFRKKHPRAHVLIFRKEAEKRRAKKRDKQGCEPSYPAPSPGLIHWFDKEAACARVRVRQFGTWDELAKLVFSTVGQLGWKPDPEQTTKRAIVRYTGADFIGLVESVAGVLFHTYALNIDYISHASRGGKATLYISCSSRGKTPQWDGLERTLRRTLRQAALDARKQHFLMPGASSIGPIDVSVEPDRTPPPTWQFYVEIRAIDAPGQLNNICREIRKLRFNIDELQLKPTPPEYPRQTTVNLWLSRIPTNGAGSASGCRAELAQLEARIRMLVGVHTFTIKVVDCRCGRRR
jgi:predicted amino acid-binding ACT domain protein